MLTWKIWRGLRNPPQQHQLFRRVMVAPLRPTPWYVGCAVILIAPLLLLPAILFTSAFYSLRWAVTISSMIARTREAGMFDLISLSPDGALGASWAICTASIHRNQSLQQIQSPMSWLVRLGFTLLILASVGNFVEPLVPFGTNSTLGTIIPLLYLFTLSGALYVDHMQSVAMGSLIGMLMPTYTRSRIDGGVGAFIVFLLLQVTTYVLTLLIGFSFLPSIFRGFDVTPTTAAILLPILRLVIFWAIREGMIAGLWRVLVERLNIAASEMVYVTRQVRGYN
jgi:hypothetical protein